MSIDHLRRIAVEDAVLVEGEVDRRDDAAIGLAFGVSCPR